MNDAPSGYRIEQAVAAWQSARSRLLTEDTDLAHDEAALTELLGPEEGDVDAILERLMRAARRAESLAAAAKEEMQDLQARKARYENRASVARQAAFSILQAIDRNKFETAGGTWSVRAGQPSVLITDGDKIPDIYVRIERIPDKQTILSALKSGLTVDGCELTNGLPSLSLRKK
jgi:hypothetical protein